jgi:hypothetical protein
LRDLFLSDHNFVLIVTEFALPDLVTFSISEHTHLVEDGLTALAYLGITSRHLAFDSEDVKGDLEDISVELLSVNILFDFLCGAFRGHNLATYDAFFLTAFLVTQVQVSAEVI